MERNKSHYFPKPRKALRVAMRVASLSSAVLCVYVRQSNGCQ